MWSKGISYQHQIEFKNQAESYQPQTYIVFQVGEVGVPAQADNVYVHDTVFG